MITDSLQSGDIVELKWLQPSTYETTTTRTVRVILTVPNYMNEYSFETFEISSTIRSWNCQSIYDSHEKRKEIPYNKYYEVKWLKLCERQGNIKIISQAHLKDETNK